MKKLLLIISISFLVVAQTASASSFGRNDIGGTADQLSASTQMECTYYTAPEDGLITNVSQWQTDGGAGVTATQWKAVIIDASTNNILTNGVSNSTAVAVGSAWSTTTFAVSPSITGGHEYGLCWVSNGISKLYFADAGGGEGDLFDGTNNFTTPTNPTDGAFTPGFYTTIYATYTPTGVRNQTSFRFRNDNGSESGASGFAAESTNITQSTLTSTRLRLQASTTGDVSASQFMLEYKLSSDSSWTIATTTANQTAAPFFVGKGVFAAGTGQIAIQFPSPSTLGAVGQNINDGDLAVLMIESANQTIATPTGWTQVANSPQSTGTAAAAGGVRLGVFYKFLTGLTPDLNVADSGNETAGIVAVFRGVSRSNPIDITAGSVNAAATNAISAPAVTTTGPNRLIINAIGLDKDLADLDTLSGEANANLTNLTEQHDQTDASGAGGGIAFYTGTLASAGSTGNTTATGDTSTTHAYVTIALNPIVQKFVITGSSNIAASGENTTAQLSVPGGKSFTAGRIQDDENPADSVDIAADNYSEFEWNLQATNDASPGDVYQFRIARYMPTGFFDGPFNIYDAIPQWTIGTAAAVTRPRLVLSPGKLILGIGKLIIR